MKYKREANNICLLKAKHLPVAMWFPIGNEMEYLAFLRKKYKMNRWYKKYKTVSEEKKKYNTIQHSIIITDIQSVFDFDD